MAKLRFQAKSTGLVRVKNFLKSAQFTYPVIVILSLVIGVLCLKN